MAPAPSETAALTTAGSALRAGTATTSAARRFSDHPATADASRQPADGAEVAVVDETDEFTGWVGVTLVAEGRDVVGPAAGWRPDEVQAVKAAPAASRTASRLAFTPQPGG